MNRDWLVVGDDPRHLLRSRGRSVALDVETTGLDYHDTPLGVALAWRDSKGELKSTYLQAPTGQVSLFAEQLASGYLDIGDVMEDLYVEHNVIYHNEVFDHRAMFRALGEDPHPFPEKQTHDTMHLARLLEFQSKRTLIHLYSRYVGKPLPEGHIDTKGKRKKLAGLPLDQVAGYGRTDAENTLELFEVLRPRVQMAVSDTLYDFDREYALLVMKMVRRGLNLDFRWCLNREQGFRDRMLEIEAELYRMGRLMSIASNVKVAVFLFKVLELDYLGVPQTTLSHQAFAGGVPSVSSEVLEQMEDRHEAIGLILEWRSLNTAITRWINPFREHAQIDGKIHSLLNPFGTISARMAASRPNVQAIPMEDRGEAFGSMLGMFKGSSKGHNLWAIDYAQIETRIAAVMAHESNLLEALNSDKDPYEIQSIDMFNTPNMRNEAKRATLASIYGIGVDKFCRQWNLEPERGAMILGTFRRFNPRLQSAANLAERFAEDEGCVRAYTGQPRWFGPDENKYKAFNQKVQMTVAEILKRAMMDTEFMYPGSLRLQVHDSVVMDIPSASRRVGIYDGPKRTIKNVKEIMVEAVPEEFRKVVKFKVDAKKWQ
jgi:DNA polymerase-1